MVGAGAGFEREAAEEATVQPYLLVPRSTRSIEMLERAKRRTGCAKGLLLG